ncbi:MAG: glycosyl hydrolase family 18 protein [Candidatus Levyibacteriota bacterium]
MVKRLLLLLVILLIISTTGLYLYLEKRYPETKPMTSLKYFAEHLLIPHAKLHKYVIGFLPYWQLDTMQYLRPQDLSEINYFSLTADSDGTLQTENQGNAERGWSDWNKQSTKDFITKSQIMGANVTFTVSALDDTTIESLLDSPSAQAKLISQIVDQVKNRQVNGVNIDFEYSGDADAQYVSEFTDFSKKLSVALKKQNPKTQLSLSIMPLSARQNDIYAFTKLVPLYDRFIGMSYDYYGQNADISGPTAPMDGFKQNKYFFDVTTTYADYLQYIPKNKLIMGVAYYGWERAVLDGRILKSKTYSPASASNYSAVISYARGREDKDLLKNKCKWDTLAQETWCWFTDKQSGIDHQAWLADDKSVQARFDYANKLNLNGIAIWTLGLDKNYSTLWNKITASF